MATYSRPGVYIQEVALPQIVQLADTGSAVGAMAGALPIGNTTAPVLTTNWSDFVKNFGGLNDSYPTTWAAYNFYANGGRNLYVKRVVGSGAAKGTITVTDGASGSTTLTAGVTAASATSGTVTYTANNTFTVGQTVSITGLSTTAFNLTSVTIATRSATQFTVTNAATGTAVTGATATATVTYTNVPATSFTISALTEGAWSSNYGVLIGPAGVSTRFGLTVFGPPLVAGVLTSNPLEQFTDLSMDPTDKYYFASVLNTSSNLIRITGTITNSVFPGTAGTTPTLFGSGSDGAAVARTDYYNASGGTVTGAWSTFDPIQNPLVIYNPDAAYAASSSLTQQLHGDAVIYAASREDAFVVIDTPSGLSATAAQESVTSTVAVFSGATAGGIAAAYYPWINIPDATKIPGALRLQAPGAAVVGQYLATDAVRGPAKTPAGLNNKIALAVSTEMQFTNAQLDTINTSVDPINAIRNVPGAGIVIMGGRTLENTPNNRYINIRRSLIYIKKELTDRASFAVFENNDEKLWLDIRTALGTFLRNYWNEGGLRGADPSQAFYVKCDSSTTSFSDIQNGRVNIEVGVALQYPAEFVVIKLGQLTGNAQA
jgi:hypothetical protein